MAEPRSANGWQVRCTVPRHGCIRGQAAHSPHHLSQAPEDHTPHLRGTRIGFKGTNMDEPKKNMDEPKKMTLVQLTVIVAVNMMGSGIIMLPANMAKVGAISLLSWAVTAVGSMAIAYGFAQAGLFNQRSGGMAAYAEDAYGKPGFFMTFYLYFFSLAIGNVAIAISAVGYLATFFPSLSATPIATCVGVIGLVWL